MSSMLGSFPAVLLLIACPLVYFAARWNGPGRPLVRALAVAAALAILLLHFPLYGATWEELRRLRLVIATIFVAALVATHGREDANRRPWLWLAALTALIVYLNFFRLHGPSTTFVHTHDFAHYYLGSKYAPELGYGGIYAAMLRAEIDAHGRVVSDRARDLAADRMVPAAELASLGETVRGRFSDERWQRFRDDARYFRERLAQNYPAFLADHGYNPSPVWSLIGGTLANLTTASDRSVWWLGLGDVAIFAAIAATVARTMGGDALALATAYYCLAFGSELGWVGGGYLRQMWFGGLVGFAVCLGRAQHGGAALLLAIATMLRVFPSAFAVGLLGRALGELRRTRRIPTEYARFFAVYVGAAAALLGATLVYPGLEQWRGFLDNTLSHSQRAGFNSIGLLQSATWLFSGSLPADPDAWLERVRLWRESFATIHLVFVLVPALLIVLWRSQALDDLRAAAFGALLLICGLNLSAYYYTFLVIVVLAFRERANALAWLFGIELAVHALHLFEADDRPLHLYKGLLAFYALVAIYLPERSQESAPVRATTR